MPGTLYQLGSFAFNLPDGAPDLLDRRTAYRWVAQDRLGREPAQQWLGPDADELVITGILMPGFSGKQGTVETLRALAATGEAQMLTSGSGYVFGLQCIQALREAKTVFMDDGNARRIVFDIELKAYGPDANTEAAGPFGGNIGGLLSPSSALAGIAPFVGGASAFAAGAWANNPFVAGTVDAALGSGLSTGLLSALAQTFSSAGMDAGAAMPAALGAFGIAPTPALTAPQAGAWTGLGLDPTALLGAVSSGQAAPAMAVGLDVLRAATAGQLSALGGGTPNVLQGLLGNAATLGSILDVDPQTTEQIRALLTLE